MKHIAPYCFSWFAIAGLVLLFFQGCASVPDKLPPSKPYTQLEVENLLHLFNQQAGLVDSFFSSGSAIIKDGESELDAHALIVGTRKPFRLKIEITHLWGRPLAHVLIREESVWMISFREKRYFNGHIEDLCFEGFSPGRLKPSYLWSFLRGFPPLVSHDKVVSLKGGRITLLGKEGEVKQVIHFDPETDLPSRICFSKEGMVMSFSGFEKENHIKYGREIRLRDKKMGAEFTFKVKEMVFNETIPMSIFELEIPPGFKEVPLHEPGESGLP